MVWWETSRFLLKVLSGPCVANRISVLEKYWFIEKFLLHKNWSQSVWSKSEINLLLSNFLQSCLNILDFAAENFKKKPFKKINCERWSENVDGKLPDSISSKVVDFEKMLTSNIEVLKILVGSSV